MKFKPSTIVSSAALGLGILAAGAGITFAATDTAKTNPMNNLVTAIAQKFNLNTADVQQVFDEQHKQMEAQMQQVEQDRLAQLVTDGKLTQEQADKITAKRAEMEAQREANKTSMEGQTAAQRQVTMKAEMDSLKQWATDNNIPMEYLRPGHGKGPGHGGFGKFGPGPQGDQPQADTATQAQ